MGQKPEETKSPPSLSSATETTGKTLGSDLRRMNEVRAATGRSLDNPRRGKPDANVNTPRGGKTVER
jgi:hypothetical protein